MQFPLDRNQIIKAIGPSVLPRLDMVDIILAPPSLRPRKSSIMPFSNERLTTTSIPFNPIFFGDNLQIISRIMDWLACPRVGYLRILDSLFVCRDVIVIVRWLNCPTAGPTYYR